MTDTLTVDPAVEAVSAIVARAREAQRAIEHYTQQQADELCTAVAWAVARPDRASVLAKLAVDEGGFGNYGDKVTKINKRVLGVLADMRTVKTVGVVEDDPTRGLIKIAKPVGVIAALIPTTGPDATPPLKTLMALKGRNAIVVAPHPRTVATTMDVVETMRKACEQVGAPADLIQVIDKPSISKTQELMRQADLIVATGGAGMVQAAYSSGTPAYGVGVGNSVHVVDETADLDDAAAAIVAAKTFDFATSCLADNAIVVEESVYEALMSKLVKRGGYICDAEESVLLQSRMWPDGGHVPTPDVIAKSALHIADISGFSIPEDRTFLLVEETGTGPDHPFSGEKLSVVLTAYKYKKSISAAIDLVNAITEYQGLGHTCGIHSTTEAHIEELATRTKTARVMVNQNLNEGAGSPRNGLPFTLSLSCGTWGGNITTENVNARHFVNLTWVSRPIQRPQATEEELFADFWAKYGR
ncbi:NAD-dependent aldehyde dehydrogenase (plasmid) [Mycolicibacterium chubuense NBB4]|uniref:NAD-dependent aldehyde dehydrogenase n=1 Tax=Mycolicibacterium chubuense (strain NBB4) TaxID=710421 RepID=I4BTF3_MYCCN|nr:aldehyde dehydrogenase family protein [Mycolicibacterium chubuense]AFM20560.1 NAD-dependent aldehyde dehydrogenase [Mycolicibacterium chubuense NBB4]